MFGKSSTGRTFSPKIDASHTVGNKYKRTGELMRGPSSEYVDWRNERTELSRQMVQATNPIEKKMIRAKLLGEIVSPPAQRYATVIEPLRGTDMSEIGRTSGGKIRSPEDQLKMKQYLQYTGRYVNPENSSRTANQKKKEPEDTSVARAKSLADSIEQLLSMRI
jgi:hypothetical protein